MCDALPCRRLWAAVVCAALNDYAAALRFGRNLDAALNTAAGRWLFDDCERVAGFVWVCNVLDLDPGALRKQLTSADAYRHIRHAMRPNAMRPHTARELRYG